MLTLLAGQQAKAGKLLCQGFFRSLGPSQEAPENILAGVQCSQCSVSSGA